MSDRKPDSLEEVLEMVNDHYPVDHEPDGWPAIQMRDLTLMADEIERLREVERLAIAYKNQSMRPASTKLSEGLQMDVSS